MIAHVDWFKEDWTGTHIRYRSTWEGTADMGMAEPTDPRMDTSTCGTNYYRYPVVIHISNADNIGYPSKPWINPCKFKDNNPRRPIDPTELRRHFELSVQRNFIYSRRPAPPWKPRTAVILRSNPRWRSGKWKAKT